MCQRFGCLPSQLLDEDADLLQLLAIEEAGTPPERDLGDPLWT